MLKTPRSKMSILLSVVTIIAIVTAFMVTVVARGGTSHAAGAAPGYTQTKGTVASAGSGKLTNAPVAPYKGSPQVLKYESLVNREGANGGRNTARMTSGAPQVASTAVTSAASPAWSKSHAGKLLESFDGVPGSANDMLGFELAPPDQGLCVGTITGIGKIVVEPVNDVYSIYAPNGTLIAGPIPLYVLFQEPPFNIITGTGSFLSDPRCQYDPSTGYFFFTILAIDFADNTSHFDIAVANPAGAVVVYRFDTTDASNTARGCPCFGDQPLLGIDKYNVYVSLNEFPISQPSPFYNGAEVFAVSKSQMEAFAASVNFAEFAHISDQGILIETLQPAITYDNNAPAEYLLHSFTVDAAGNNNSFDHRLGIFAITNQAAVTAGGFPTLSNPTVINSEFYAQPDQGLQPNGLVLNADDDRMQQVQYINGNLMAELSTAVSIKGDTITRTGGAWFDIEPSLSGSLTVNAHIKRQGYIAAKGLYVLYPAVAQSRDGTVEMAFSIVSPTITPSAAYAVVPDGTNANNAGAIFVAGTGTSSYSDTFTCTASPFLCRWGDYSWATLDPGTMNIWMGTEYVPPQSEWGLFMNWGTRLYEVSA
jgi:hypothetical protein